MAEKEERVIPEYNSEELEAIKDLTSYFNLAPGQVLPEGQSADDDNYEELAGSHVGDDDELSEDGEDADEDDVGEEDEFAPPVLSSMSKEDDDLDALLSLDPDQMEPTDDIPENAPAEQIIDDSFDTPDSAEDLDVPAPANDAEEIPATDLGDLDDLSNLDENASETDVVPPQGDAEEIPAADLGELNDLGDLGDLDENASETDVVPPQGDAEEIPATDLGDLDDLGDLGDLDENANETDVVPPQGDAEEIAATDLGDLDENVSETDVIPPENNAEEVAATDLGGLDDLDNLEAANEVASPETDAVESGLGDLGDLNDLGDLGDLDSQGFGDTVDLSAVTPEGDTDEIVTSDLVGLDDLSGFDDLEQTDVSAMDSASLDAPVDENNAEEDLNVNLDELSNLSIEDSQADDTQSQTAELDSPSEEKSQDDSSLVPPSLDELSPNEAISHAVSSSAFYAQEDLTDDELRLVNEALKELPYALRKTFIDTILGDRLNISDTRELVNEIIGGAGSERIKNLLEEKIGEGIDLNEEVESSRVVFSRESYTGAGLERQAKLIKRTKYVALAAIILLTLTNVSYFYIYKPIRYNKLLSWGNQEILDRQNNFLGAEEYFTKAIALYPERSKAYIQFGESYKRIGEYEKSFAKLFGDIELVHSDKAVRYANQEIRSKGDMWHLLKKVPIVKNLAKSVEQKDDIILVNEIPFRLKKDGAYTLSHLKNKEDEGAVLLALGNFHSNPVNKFHDNPLRNNLLGVDYFQRILNFENKSPFFSKAKFDDYAVAAIGDVYYNQKDYYKAQNYFEKIIRRDPYNPIGQSGVLRSLLRIYKETDDPRLIIQQHGEIRNKLKIQDKLPLYMLATLAAFYIDLPDDDSLRILYNISPTDNVDNSRLKERSRELLDILFKSSQKDSYGNKIEGKDFAEGFYQRGRYYRERKQTRMALKQMEYAYLYEPRHFLALSDRGEMLMQLNDYQGAMQNFRLALKQMTPEKLNLLGDQPQDETLLDADFGRIYFNMGKAIYLTSVANLGETQDWTRIQETQKYRSQTNDGAGGLNEILDQADSYFSQARNIGVKNPEKRLELAYYSGWSQYAKGNFRSALEFWESIDSRYQRKYPALELAKSHALYRLAVNDTENRETHLQAALGYLLFLEGKYNNQTSAGKPLPNNKQQIELYSRIAIIENNIGAIYELLQDEESSLRHYWLSVNASKKIAQENEVANLNIQLNFKRDALEGKERFPVILDFVPPNLKQL